MATNQTLYSMMKKMFAAVVMLVMALTASAQNDAGTFSLIPKVGVSIAKLSKSDLAVAGYGDLDPKYKPGFTAGLEGEYQLTDMVSLSLGAFYTTLGCRYDDVEVLENQTDEAATYSSYQNTKTTLGYVQVPLMANVYVAKGFALKAGFQIGMLTNAKTQSDIAEVNLNKTTQVRSFGERTSYKNTDKDSYNKADISIPVGASYEYMNVVIDARYYIGLNKASDTSGARNRAFEFTVGYKFNL